MFNKEGIPFFTIMIPFLSIIFVTFFATSYYLKLSNENFEVDLKEYKINYVLKRNDISLNKIIEEKKKEHILRQNKYKDFMIVLTSSIIIFIALFSYLMTSIINDVIKKYKLQVKNEEIKLQTLNKTLASKVEIGIKEAKKKDKAILEQSKLARMGVMISMIAHQWRQPLTELSGILMELETATRFKKVNDEHILNSIEKSDKTIEFMSNTIDDFRNFYKPDKKKENFNILQSCQKAVNLINASLADSLVELSINVKKDKNIYGYPREFSQVILNLISNAKDILEEKSIKNPKIELSISSKGMLSIIKVKDNAGGIKEENLDLIFDPYFSTKDSTKGTGLGLYISKLIIERNMGGELSVYNDKDGAVFQIVILG
ncbi:sensor histidine kinase [Poseidonibacter antarcticus]|uniref:sensor histidine kinase n=1 Tax=Poseidonibacter antarcticus TaxID=2478538 RepID=UPI000EF4F19C|nr:HAMP domain-containing sensor histidine kinase [Poseidonibacter antarcticus]